MLWRYARNGVKRSQVAPARLPHPFRSSFRALNLRARNLLVLITNQKQISPPNPGVEMTTKKSPHFPRPTSSMMIPAASPPPSPAPPISLFTYHNNNKEFSVPYQLNPAIWIRYRLGGGMPPPHLLHVIPAASPPPSPTPPIFPLDILELMYYYILAINPHLNNLTPPAHSFAFVFFRNESPFRVHAYGTFINRMHPGNNLSSWSRGFIPLHRQIRLHRLITRLGMRNQVRQLGISDNHRRRLGRTYPTGTLQSKI